MSSHLDRPNRVPVIVVAAIAMLLLCGIGTYWLFFRGRTPPAGNLPGPESPATATAGSANKLANAVWTLKEYKSGYKVEFPGEPVVEDALATRLGHGPFVIRGLQSVTFSDTDLKLMSYAEASSTSEAPLDRFYAEHTPVFPTKENGRWNVVENRRVDTNGKAGWEFKLEGHKDDKVNPDLIYYRIFRTDKRLYVVMASGTNLPAHMAVVSRFFNSLQMEGDQTEPLALASLWRKYRDSVSGYEVDMPGQVKESTIKDKETGDPIREAEVKVKGTDLVFLVSCTRLAKRDNTPLEEFFAESRKSFLDEHAGANVLKEERMTTDGRESLQLTIEVDSETIVWRAFRVQERRCEFEMEVTGSQLQNHQEDIQRFFGSFRFVVKKSE